MKTKISILSLAFVSLLLVSCTQQAKQIPETIAISQDVSHTIVEKYIVLTNNVQQIKAISNAAQMMSAGSPDEFGGMEVVVCGKTVVDMTNAEIMAPLLEVIKDGGLDVKVCGFSLKQQSVDASMLPSQISVVENGIHYNFRKQHEGYNSLGL